MATEPSNYQISSNYENVVQQLYVCYFGRPADYSGLQHWMSALSAMGAPTTLTGIMQASKSNPAIAAVINGFGASSESNTLYGGGDTISFVSSIYNNLLSRSPDFEGLIFWAGLIDQGYLTRSNAVLAIADGAVMNLLSPDTVVFQNKVGAAVQFTQEMDTVNEVRAYTGAEAAQIAREMLSEVQLTPASNGAIATTLTAIVDLAFPPPPPPPAPEPTPTPSMPDSYSMSYFIEVSGPSSPASDLFFP